MILSTTNRLKGYSPGQLLFGCDINIPIKYMAYWKLIRHQNQTQINKDNIGKNGKILEHDYKVRDKVMLNDDSALKYKTLYIGPF